MLSFIRENARWIGGGFLLTFLSSFGQTFFISLSSSEVRATFDLSHGGFGTLYMVATLASAATLPFLGKIVDVISVRRTLLIVVPALAAACVGFAFAPGIVLLGIVIYGLRLFGQGMLTHTAMTAMGRWYAAQRGKAVSIVALGHQAGEMALPLLFAGLMAAGIGWRSIWVGCGVFLLLVGLPVAAKLLAVERTPQSRTGGTSGGTVHDWTRGEVLADPLFWITMTGVLAPAFIGTTVFFHQNYLVELNEWSLVVFASGFTVMGAVTIAAGLGAGFAIDRIGAVRLLPIFSVPLAAACFVVGTMTAEWSIFLFFLLLGTSYGISQTLFGALWPEIYGTTHLGAIRSGIVAMMVFATAAGPGLTGWLIDQGIDLPTQMQVAGAYCIAMGVILFGVSRAFLRREGVAVDAVPTYGRGP